MKSLKNIRKKKLKLNKHKQKYFVESDDQSDLSDEVSVISRESSSSDNNATPGIFYDIFHNLIKNSILCF